MAWNQKSKGYRAFTSVVFTVNYWFCCTPSLTSIWLVTWEIRCYPLRFGMKIVEIFPRLLKDCKPVECPPDANGETIFESMEYGDMCPDADLRSCILYIRGSVRLQIPPSWRKHLPTHIWEAFYGNPDGPSQKIYIFGQYQFDQKKQSNTAIYGHIPQYLGVLKKPYPYWNRNLLGFCWKKTIPKCWEKNQIWAVFQGFSLDAFCSELRCFWKWVSAKAPTIDIQHLKFHTCETFQIRVWEIVFGKCEYTSTSLLCSMYDVFTWYPSLMRSVFTFPSAILWTNRCGVLGECPSLCSPVFGAALPWVLVKITSWQLRRRGWPASNKWKWS